MTTEVETAFTVLWNWMCLDMAPTPADAIVAFGCYDEQIPLRAVELWRQGLAPLVVFSGGLGRNTRGRLQTSEAVHFAAIAKGAGLPEANILLEERSTNSAENLQFTKELLSRRGIPVSHILAIHKPYMERRFLATAPVCWPEMRFTVTSPQVTIAQHLQATMKLGIPEREVIETVVGDVQRMEIYPRKGYQLPEEIPDAVRTAYEDLVDMGYTGQLVRE